MSLQRLHAFEKTSIQARHTIKRLEMFTETTRNDEELQIAEELLTKFKEIRKLIPSQYSDVDIRKE